MSLAVENAYKFKGEIDINTLKKYTDNISKYLKERLVDMLNEEVSKLISLVLDLKQLGQSKEDIRMFISYMYDYDITEDLSLYKLLLNLIERDSNSNMALLYTFDFKTNLLLYPINNKVLFIVSSSKNLTKMKIEEEVIDLIEKDFPVVSYDYWNNTDKPDEISDEEWKVRSDDWNKTIYNPFEWKINIDKEIQLAYVYYKINKITKSIEDLYEHRIETLSNHLIGIEIEEKVNNDFGAEDDKQNFNLMLNKVREYRKSDFFKERKKTIKKELYNKIPKSYTKEDIKIIKL